MSTRVLVAGGRGFLGRRVVSALRRLEDVEVAAGSRRGGGGRIRLDLADSASRPVMADFDVVVDCSDSRRSSPELAARDCLHRGSVFVETTASPDVAERVWREAREVPDPRGTVILGAGLFPGLSNLLAAALWRARGGGERLELCVRWSPWSAAGSGTCALMADLAGRPVRRYEDGQRIESPPLALAELSIGDGHEAVLAAPMVEALTLHWSLGAASTAAWIAPRPRLPRPVLRLGALLVPWELLRLPPLRWAAAAGLGLVRRGVFGWRRMPVELLAVADRGAGPRPALARLSAADGFAAAGAAVAAVVASARRNPPGPGVWCVEQACRLDDVLEDLGRTGAGIAAPEMR